MSSQKSEGTFEPPNRNVARRFVIVQFVILIALVLVGNSVGPQLRQFPIFGFMCVGLGLLGLFLSASNLGRTLTAMPIPKSDGELCTSGIYGFVRHPIYSFVLLLCLGLCLQSGSVYKYLLTFLLAVLFYFKSNYEERYLFQKYPEYEAYSQRVPRFIPFIK